MDFLRGAPGCSKIIMILRKVRKLFHPLEHSLAHLASTEGNFLPKYVYISESNDIFVNLAFEDWLYQNYDFSKQQILLLWRNKPTVVVGRHQNPWLEANVKLAQECNTLIARRNSGGGAVYHDMENLNLSFFTSKTLYDRKYNLEIITNSIENEWALNCVINNREDITFDNKKISGTASKLSKDNAYHHCTLLVDCNKKTMSAMLGTKDPKIVTNATRSVPSPVINLREINSSVNVDRLMTVVGLGFLRAKPLVKLGSKDFLTVPKGFHFVCPEEKYFPGLQKRIEQFRSWEWIYGRTPKFKTEFSFSTAQFCSASDIVRVHLEIEHAEIRSIDVEVPPSFLVFVTSESLSYVTAPYLKHTFSNNVIVLLERALVNYFKSKLEDQRLNSVL